jgi:uncharacterized protein (TIRG00374 family)
MKLDTKTMVGLAVTAACLVWVFHGVDFAEVWRHLLDANLPLLLLAGLLATLGMPFRALRWKSLLPPDANASFQARNAAVSLGFAANNLLPARIGEFARVLTLNRLTGLPLGTALGSLVLERVFDGFVVLALLFGAMAAPGFPGLHTGGEDPRRYAYGVAVVAGGLAVVLLALAFFPRRSVAVAERMAGVLPASFRRPLVDSLHSFVASLGVLRSPRRLLVTLLWAVAQWLFLSVSYLVAMRAFGITAPGFVGAAFMQGVTAVAVSVPAAPGFWGVQEVAAKIALSPWNVPEARLLSFAIGFHIVGWLPVTALGLWYAARLNLSLTDMKRSEARVEDAVEHDPSIPQTPAEVERGA